MIAKARSFKKALLSSVAFPVVIAVLLVANPAMAAGVSGPIIQIEYNASTSNPVLMVQVNNGATNYFAQQVSPGCSVPALSADALKALLSIAQTALLAGKPTTVYYNTCGGNNYIYDIVMTR